MSYTITEIDSKRKRGREFNGNWAPLWAYIAELCGDILTDDEVQQGFMSDGLYISRETAQTIYKRISKQLDSGTLTTYHPDHGFHIDDLRALVQFLKDSRGFTIS